MLNFNQDYVTLKLDRQLASIYASIVASTEGGSLHENSETFDLINQDNQKSSIRIPSYGLSIEEIKFKSVSKFNSISSEILVKGQIKEYLEQVDSLGMNADAWYNGIILGNLVDTLRANPVSLTSKEAKENIANGDKRLSIIRYFDNQTGLYNYELIMIYYHNRTLYHNLLQQASSSNPHYTSLQSVMKNPFEELDPSSLTHVFSDFDNTMLL